jgi:tetratricopeptide (TPR) repeat protein
VSLLPALLLCIKGFAMLLKKNARSFCSLILCALLGASAVHAETSPSQPVSTQALLSRATSAEVAGEYKNATFYYTQVIQRGANNDDSESAYLGLIKLFIKDGQLQKARRLFDLFERNHKNPKRLLTVLDIQKKLDQDTWFSRWFSWGNIFKVGGGIGVGVGGMFAVDKITYLIDVPNPLRPRH